MTLIGRAHQVEYLLDLLEQPSTRLVNLTGPAGVGKTRLAQEVAGILGNDMQTHSVTFASLADSALLPVRLAKSLDITPVQSESWESRVIDYLRDIRMVLLLDNLEHLLPIPFIPRLLTACPHIQLVTTSRVLLHLSEEHMLRVPPLEIPPDEQNISPDELKKYDSVQLLVQRARRVLPEFEITAENADDIATLVRELDGLPLALELAAARLNTFGASALRARLHDRMSLLIGGPMDRPEHQRTLRSTIAWSYQLLSPEEQRLFRRMSILTGSVSPEMALAVCGEPDDTIELIIELADCSLLQLHQESCGQCSMLESMRIFAIRELKQSGEEEAIRSRLADYCIAEVTRLAPELIGVRQAETVDIIEDLQVHFNASLQWLSTTNHASRFVELACSLFRYWRIRGLMVEAEYWLDLALTPNWQPLLTNTERARAFATAAWVAFERGNTATAHEYAELTRNLADSASDQLLLGQAWRVLALVESRQDHNDLAIDYMQLSLDYFREAEDADGVAGTLNNLAILALDNGDWERVIDLCEESTRAFRSLGNIHGASHSLDTMGIAQYELHRYGDAMRSTLASLKIDRSVNDTHGLAVTLDHVGKIARAQGDLPGAWEAHAESLTYRNHVGDPRGILVWLQAMAHWLVEAGRAELAARILGALEIARTSGNLPLNHHETGDHNATVEGALRALGEDRYLAAVAKGRWASLDDLTREVSDIANERVLEIVAGTPIIPDGIGEQYGLTDREEEVFHLIARRLSDKEIADELSISARTVNRHVSNLLAKLDVRTRRDAAILGDQARNG